MLSTMALKPSYGDSSQRRSPHCCPPWLRSHFRLISVKGDHPNAVHYGSDAISSWFQSKETTPVLSTMAPMLFYPDFCWRRPPQCCPLWLRSYFMLISVTVDHPNAVHRGFEAMSSEFQSKEFTPMLSTMALKPCYGDLSQRRSPYCCPLWLWSHFMLISTKGDHPIAVHQGSEAIQGPFLLKEITRCCPLWLRSHSRPISVKGDHPNVVHCGTEAILCWFQSQEPTPMPSTMAPKPL